jgi:glycosyltransferase involved in cell wall biosynthesis
VSRSMQEQAPVVISVNQDPGIGPDRAKGAAVHLKAMREAFCAMGAQCLAMDEPDDQQLWASLEERHRLGAIDLMYERYALGKSTAARFAAEHDVPLVLEVNAPLAQEQRRWRGASDEAEDARQDTLAMGQACGVIAVSGDVASYAVARGAHENRVEVFPNGIDTGRFNLELRQNSVRHALVPPGRFVIGFHGRLRPWHGFDMLVDVTLELLGQHCDVHLLVVGEGDFEDLERLPEDRYTRIPWQAHEEVPRYVAAFDVLPLTYKPDMPCYFSPLKLMEAMACGVVPVVPALGDLPAVVDHCRTGLVYRAGDSNQLRMLLQSLIADRERLERVGLAAAHEAGRHSWGRIANYALQVAADSTSLPPVGLKA